MSTVELLRRLQDSDVRVFVQDGRLRVNAGRGVLDDALLAELRAHRDALIALLAAADAPAPSFPRVERTPAMPCARTESCAFEGNTIIARSCDSSASG